MTAHPGIFACGRCGELNSLEKANECFFCKGDICEQCFNDYKHCGHPAADLAEIMRQVRAGADASKEVASLIEARKEELEVMVARKMQIVGANRNKQNYRFEGSKK